MRDGFRPEYGGRGAIDTRRRYRRNQFNKKSFLVAVTFLLCIGIAFSGCAGTPETQASTGKDDTPIKEESPQTQESQIEQSLETAEQGDWSPTEPIISEFNDEGAIEEAGVSLDISSVSLGYAAVKAENPSRLKFQVVFGEKKYNYDLPGDGTAIVVPLQSGDGLYTFRVLQNTDGNKYVEIFSAEKQVELEDEFAPFVRPNVMVNFDEQSVCVQKARELAEGIRNDAQFVASVYDYLKNAITYDYAFAQSNPTMYYPDPDTTLETGKGICFDYAAVAAAMLRSCGIPTKLVTGYVTSSDIYHAWNMIYLQDQGWITMEISVDSGVWQVIDVTFASTGQDSEVEENSYKEKDEY